MSRPSYAQAEELLKFMEAHPDLAVGRANKPGGRHRSEALWQAISLKLNAIAGGCFKEVNVWKKYWSDKRKYVKNAALKRESSLDEFPEPTPQELRILALVTANSRGRVTSPGGELKEFSLPSENETTMKAETDAAEMSLDSFIDSAEHAASELVYYMEQVDVKTSIDDEAVSEQRLSERKTRPRKRKLPVHNTLHSKRYLDATSRDVNKRLTLLEEQMRIAEERRMTAQERQADVEERRAAVEERRAAAEERLAIAQERQASAGERQAAAQERQMKAFHMLSASMKSLAEAQIKMGDIQAKAAGALADLVEALEYRSTSGDCD